jgi:fluoride ion exporter CrcB/FEX
MKDYVLLGAGIGGALRHGSNSFIMRHVATVFPLNAS